MAKAKYVNPSRGMTEKNLDMNVQQDVQITESVDELIDPDLFLRSFGISDDYVDQLPLQNSQTPSQDTNPRHGIHQGVIIKNDYGQNVARENMTTLENFMEFQPQDPHANQKPIFMTSGMSQMGAAPVTLQQRKSSGNESEMKTLSAVPSDTHVTIPFEMFQSILNQPNSGDTKGRTLETLVQYKQVDAPVTDPLRKRSHSFQSGTLDSGLQNNGASFSDNKIIDTRGFTMPTFTVPSPVALSPIYVEQKPTQVNSYDGLQVISPKQTSRPSPQSTPPPSSIESMRDRSTWTRNEKSGRITPTGKRSRPQTPTSDCESDGGYRDREPHSWNTGRSTPGESKPAKLEEMVDEEKYQKRKRSTSGGEKKKDPMKEMLEQLQKFIPHIGNPDEEKVSHAGLLVEGCDYIRSLMRENKTTNENVDALHQKIEQLNKEIEAFQEKLPEHGSNSIHKIVSTRGKSIPDMYADHVRAKTQDDWRYWVFTSIMGHFVHSFAQEVSNISSGEMERTATEWLQERMSLTQLRKDAFRKLAKLCSKTSIMEDPSKLPDEARGFVALPQEETESSERGVMETAQYGRKSYD